MKTGHAKNKREDKSNQPNQKINRGKNSKKQKSRKTNQGPNFKNQVQTS